MSAKNDGGNLPIVYDRGVKEVKDYNPFVKRPLQTTILAVTKRRFSSGGNSRKFLEISKEKRPEIKFGNAFL